MKLVDSWRLTGPNLQTRAPAALSEIAFEAHEDPSAAVAAWKAELARMARAIGLEVVSPAARFFAGGAALTFSAPIDVLLRATHVSDWAVESATALLASGAALPLEPRLSELAAIPAESPALVAIQAEARRRGVAFVWDDEALSLGLGKRSRSWALTALPAPDAIPWDEVGAIPVVLITGTNGKTTTSRLVARMAKLAGLVVGTTTTDGVLVGEQVIERGDYTGPAGARLVLRRPEVEVAILETARGGILRRGLAVDAADAALVTNVSADHLGDYGVDDVATMARVKAVVGTVVGPGGRVVLNAEDPELMKLAGGFAAKVVLFSLDAESPVVVAHRARGGEAWLARGDALVRAAGSEEHALLSAREVPIAFDGAARYNVANALAAGALAAAIGIPEAVIVSALRTFVPSMDDNPGRGNLVDVRGVKVLIDFAHNPDGVRSVFALVARLRTARLMVIGGYAGDRSDDSVRESARAVYAGAPDRVWLRDLAGYLRGREPGEVPAIFRDELVKLGMRREDVDVAPTEVLALRAALDAAHAGDLIVILAHLETDAVRALLRERSSAS